jgi:recombination protein RecA
MAKKDDSKVKAIEMAVSQIEKQFGKGAIMKLGEAGAKISVETVPTGSLSLDVALGIGGVPRGRVVEIFGPEASGKTTIALHIMAEAQKLGGAVAFIDAEHALDPIYARNLGLDVDEMLISQPDTGEQALEIAETLVRSGGVDVVVIDSVAALVPKAEIEGEMGDSHVGLQARLMSQALRKLTGVISRSKTCAVFINQVRYKIGVMFGNPMTTPGGLALKFHSSVRMEIRRTSAIKVGDQNVGNRVIVRIVKNKLAPPFRDASFDIYFGEGISRAGEVLDLATEQNIIGKSGTWFSYGEERIGQGRDNARIFLNQNPDLLAELEAKVRESLGMVRGGKSSQEKKEGD